MNRRRLVISSLMVGGAAPLAGGWPTRVAAQASTPVVRWQYTLDNGAVFGQALSDDGNFLVVVIGYGFDPGGVIVSLDPNTGAERWRLDIDEAPSSSPIIVDGVLYAGIGSLVTGRSAVYALDIATGEQHWRTDISNSAIPATPVDGVATQNGTLFVNRGDAMVLALDAATGAKQWERQLDKPQRGAPAIGDGLVYIATGFDGAQILALDASSGETRWSIEDPANPSTGPAITDGRLFVAFTNGELASFDAETGEQHWRTIAGLVGADDPTPPRPGLPLVHEGIVYVSSNGFSGAATLAFDAETGNQQWVAPTGDFSTSAPMLANNLLIIGSDSGELLGLDPPTGHEQWRVPIPGDIHLALDQDEPPLAHGTWIYVADDLGGLVGLSEQADTGYSRYGII